MKKNKLTYILLPVAIVVWVLIFYRIYQAVHKSDDNGMVMNDTSGMEPDHSATPDTFHLIAHYRDPFLGTMPRHVVKDPPVHNPVVRHRTITSVDPPPGWPDITYQGMMKNKHAALAIVKINGVSNLMKKGDTLNGLKVISIYKDSVRMELGHKRKIIKIVPAH